MPKMHVGVLPSYQGLESGLVQRHMPLQALTVVVPVSRESYVVVRWSGPPAACVLGGLPLQGLHVEGRAPPFHATGMRIAPLALIAAAPGSLVTGHGSESKTL